MEGLMKLLIGVVIGNAVCMLILAWRLGRISVDNITIIGHVCDTSCHGIDDDYDGDEPLDESEAWKNR